MAFVLGFGALELNMVYPALAGAYTLLVVIVKAAGVLHTIQHSWRATPPSQQEFKTAQATFDQIMLCDAKIPNCLR